jgi:hypothetical protein
MKILVVSDIRENWEMVRKGLAEIVAESGAEWMPEDVFRLVENGRASLFMAGDGSPGFIILQKGMISFPREKQIATIIAAWCPDSDAQGKFMAAVEKIARSDGCYSLRMDSTRRGFERRGGWKIDRIVYERTL